jgi:uncharacterized membrane protein
MAAPESAKESLGKGNPQQSWCSLIGFPYLAPASIPPYRRALSACCALCVLNWRASAVSSNAKTCGHHLGYYLLLGLEFLIAADIVHTVLTPTLPDLAILGAIAAIRTVISFSITWELRQASRHEAGASKSI